MLLIPKIRAKLHVYLMVLQFSQQKLRLFLRLPDGSSIFTAEAKAIDLALGFINYCNSYNKFVIYSDSLSVLQALNYTISKNQQIQNILLKHHSMSEFKTIVYCWDPSHVGIYGNEQDDMKAKESLNLEQILKFLLSI